MFKNSHIIDLGIYAKIYRRYSFTARSDAVSPYSFFIRREETPNFLSNHSKVKILLFKTAIWNNVLPFWSYALRFYLLYLSAKI
jgi:hypothetical protein